MKEFNQNGITLVFYQKPEDEKFSFLVKDNEGLTEQLLNSVSTKRVKEKDIKYAVNYPPTAKLMGGLSLPFCKRHI